MSFEGIEKMADRARRVDVRDTPLGVKPKKYVVEEIPLDGGKVDNKSETVSYTSADGNSYRFAMRGSDGKVLPNRIPLTLFLAMREVEVGGLASTVLKAFKVSIEDLDGKQVFPIKEEEPVVDSSDFSLGE